MVGCQAEVGCIIQHLKGGREQAGDIWQLTIDWLRKTPAGCDWVKEEIRAVEFRGGRNPPEGAHKAIVSSSELSPSVIHSISFFTVSCLSGFQQPVPLQQPRTRHTLFIQGERDKKEANPHGKVTPLTGTAVVRVLSSQIFGYNDARMREMVVLCTLPGTESPDGSSCETWWE